MAHVTDVVKIVIWYGKLSNLIHKFISVDVFCLRMQCDTLGSLYVMSTMVHNVLLGTCLIMHVSCCRVIQNIADSRPKVRYLIAKDDSQSSLDEIVRVRAHNSAHISNLGTTDQVGP
jgi:hypothetical protein